MRRYNKEMGISDDSFKDYLVALSKKDKQEWKNEYYNRLLTGCVLMEELGIGKKIIEFNDIDNHTGKRLETYSDILNDNSYEPILVSKKLETGLFDDLNTQKSTHDDFGDFYDYVCSSNNGLYNSVDSFIIGEYFDKLERYLPIFLANNKDCYYMISCINNSEDNNHYKREMHNLRKLLNYINKNNSIVIDDVESKSNDGYVRVIKMHKENSNC